MSTKNIISFPIALPIGFAQQVLQLQCKLAQQQSLQLIQILSQMYRIAVDYYINCDLRRAAFFQKKLNQLAIKSLNAPSIQIAACPRVHFKHQVQSQIHKYEMCEKTYINAIVQSSQKARKKFEKNLQQGLNRQEQAFNDRRMMRRVKSSKCL